MRQSVSEGCHQALSELDRVASESNVKNRTTVADLQAYLVVECIGEYDIACLLVLYLSFKSRYYSLVITRELFYVGSREYISLTALR